MEKRTIFEDELGPALNFNIIPGLHKMSLSLRMLLVILCKWLTALQNFTLQCGAAARRKPNEW